MKRIIGLLALATAVFAQAPNPITVSDAVSAALARYPSVRVSEEQAASAAAGINLARTSYLPHVDIAGQLNRGTRNNIFGILLPNSVIPSMSGPVLGTNDMTNVWGSAVGVLVSWEPFDFGLRKANVDVTRASEKRSEASLRRTQFEVGALAADAYLTLLAAEQTVRAAQAGVDRADVLERVIGAVVKSELRPGVDLTRAQADRALAETQVLQAHQAAEVARATLAQYLGVKPSEIATSAGPLLGTPPDPEPSINLSAHPFAVEQNAAIDEVKAREHALDRAYFPKFNLQGAEFARGSGANPNGTTGGPASGLGPEYQNWVIGFAAYFPIFDFASIHAKKDIEAHNERAETARYRQVMQDLRAGVDRAEALLEGARRIAKNTPIQLEAARQTEQQAAARYKAGLSTVVEVADAERLLTQAEIDDSLAKLNVWRAYLGLCAANGNLEPFLTRAR